MELNTETIIHTLQNNKHEVIPIKFFNSSYLVSINYIQQECDIKQQTSIGTNELGFELSLELEYSEYYNKLNLKYDYQCDIKIVLKLKLK
jgi:hypothetical protein